MFYDTFLNLCNSKGISPSAAVVEMGFQKSVVTRWKNGTIPRDANLRKVADYFGVAVEYLITPGYHDAPFIENYNPEHFAKELKYLRNRNNVSLEELSNAIDVDISEILGWEDMSSPIPDREVLRLLSDFFDVDISRLVGARDFSKETPKVKNDEITFDDFTYAMYDHSKDLTEEEKKMLLEMAEFMKKKRGL